MKKKLGILTRINFTFAAGVNYTHGWDSIDVRGIHVDTLDPATVLGQEFSTENPAGNHAVQRLARSRKSTAVRTTTA